MGKGSAGSPAAVATGAGVAGARLWVMAGPAGLNQNILSPIRARAKKIIKTQALGFFLFLNLICRVLSNIIVILRPFSIFCQNDFADIKLSYGRPNQKKDIGVKLLKSKGFFWD
jgi:hypothetical protein